MRLPRPALLPLACALFLAVVARAQTALSVASLAQLRAVAATPDAVITLAPGAYWLTGPTTRPSPAADHPIFLDLAGANTRYVFTGVTLRVDTRELRGYGRAYGHGDTVRVLQISGVGATVDGLTLRMEHVAMNGADSYGVARQYTADWSATLVELIGSGVTLRDCVFTTGGSYPYGYGDAFGKGGRPADADGVTNAAWIDHRKQSGIRVGKGASGVTLDKVTLHMRSYGHGIFFQDGASDITLRDCAVLGDALADSDTVRAHPVYQQWGAATYGEKIPAGIRLSRHEDGVRVYINDGFASNGWPQYVNNLTIENTRVERMRDAFATGDMTGALRVTAAEAYGCETGFTPSQFASENTFAACKGDAVNGPLVFFRRSAANVSMQVDLAGSAAPVGDWPVALVSGANNSVTLTRTAPAGLYPATAYINLAQAWREWRHRPAADIDASSSGNVTAPATGCTIVNQTGLPLVFGPAATGNTALSPGGVINKGSGNTYVGETLVPAATTRADTWGDYLFHSGQHTANAPDSLGGAAADPGTRVAPGAILTIGSGLAFQGEPLSLGGTLSTAGALANTTRFASSGTAAITLTGDAVMHVATAANQFLVGPISGAGALLKTGPGNLVMEGNTNTFAGALTVSAGSVTARANKARHDLVIAAGASFRGNASLSVNQPADARAVIDGTLVVNSRGAADTNAHVVNLGRLAGSGLVTSTTDGAVLGTVVVSGESDFAGVIEGALGLTKTGDTTTLALSGAHTYSGPTTVSAGVLSISGSLPASTALSLAPGATLARDPSLDPLAVGSFTSANDAFLRPSLAPAAFDPRRAYAWPVLTSAAPITTPPALDASALPATDGAYALAATAATITLTHTPAPYAAWQLERGIPHASPPTSDHDANGTADLLDYALPAPPIINPALPLSITFHRARADLVYTVETSSDLASWSTVATDPGEVGSLVTVTAPAPASDTPRNFLRLKVEPRSATAIP